ncbi:DUF3239 domain-containing protein [Microbulbifer sp. MLAF003]|uniref:DUF3239 domain-containing protein n=1 Tax=Microbulbifer sp. MLAF003 TaxID=3032582 RepID=UPI0024AC9F62|nr:DUF3239 domain-containing protein [Microbulbifer sp. MLAF003]WHI50169.1 DUF3239 domain-containing protein [Microbulbifer sp. MLAF003]
MKFTLDNDTTPTNKSHIKINPLVWMKYKSDVVIPLTASVFICVYISYKYSYLFLLGVLLFLLINTFYWLRAKEHLKAESTPGLVISTEPPLMAVYSNMTKYGEFYPAIKIESFKNLSKHPVGARIATASIYTEENEENDYWDDFHPIPVEYGTKEKEEIESALSLYSIEQWRYLERGLSELGKCKKEGLYRIMADESGWSNA